MSRLQLIVSPPPGQRVLLSPLAAAVAFVVGAGLAAASLLVLL